MMFLHLPIKTQSPSRLIIFLIISSSLCIGYLLASVFFLYTFHPSSPSSLKSHSSSSLSLDQIVFGIASNELSWPKRKDFVRLWWKPDQMRGCVFVDKLPPGTAENDTSSLPTVCVSEDTSRFRYTYRNGLRSAIRVARVVVETVRMGHTNVRWYVFGDDDTIFLSENLMKTLSKYEDEEGWYYIGSNSESYEQNKVFDYEMGYGGAGFALSYSLAKVFERVFDNCIERYPHLYGSDSRIHYCLAELGVGLTHEPGFHQVDVRGNAFGLLASHPLTPLVSLHHLDHIDPIFPNMTTIKALQHLFQAVQFDSQRLMQQTVCYDRWFSWTISISWGYAIQIFENHVFLNDVTHVQRTFSPWKRNKNVESGLFTFNTWEPHPDPCRRPVVFYFDHVSSDWKDGIRSSYKKAFVNCSFDAVSAKRLQEVRVFSQKLDLNIKQLQAPRRQCCDVLPSTVGEVMDITIRECKQEELIRIQPTQ